MGGFISINHPRPPRTAVRRDGAPAAKAGEAFPNSSPRKPEPASERHDRTLPAGEHLHQLWVVLGLDD